MGRLRLDKKVCCPIEVKNKEVASSIHPHWPDVPRTLPPIEVASPLRRMILRDEAAPSELGVATPQAMKLAIAASHGDEEGGWLGKDGSKMAGFGASHQGFSST